jgi:hypothetical protein
MGPTIQPEGPETAEWKSSCGRRRRRELLGALGLLTVFFRNVQAAYLTSGASNITEFLTRYVFFADMHLPRSFPRTLLETQEAVLATRDDLICAALVGAFCYRDGVVHGSNLRPLDGRASVRSETLASRREIMSMGVPSGFAYLRPHCEPSTSPIGRNCRLSHFDARTEIE